MHIWHHLRTILKLTSFIEVNLVVILDYLRRIICIEVHRLLRGEVSNGLLHVVVVYYLWLAWELPILVEGSCGLRVLLHM
jgi:hypothetical protein